MPGRRLSEADRKIRRGTRVTGKEGAMPAAAPPRHLLVALSADALTAPLFPTPTISHHDTTSYWTPVVCASLFTINSKLDDVDGESLHTLKAKPKF